MLLLSLRAKGENLRLVIAAGTGNARAGITRGSFENPAEPPMFCMLMRKHLVGARILSVTQPEYERLLIFTLDTHDELGVQSEKKLAVELIGRSANAVLIGADGRIIDCMRRMDFAGDALRRMLPGMIYRLPPKQEKPVFFALDPEQRRALIASADKTVPVDTRTVFLITKIRPRNFFIFQYKQKFSCSFRLWSVYSSISPRAVSTALSMAAAIGSCSFGRSSPQKQTSKVPGPQWDAVIIPMFQIGISPLIFGKRNAISCFAFSASSGQSECAIQHFPEYFSPSLACCSMVSTVILIASSIPLAAS